MVRLNDDKLLKSTICKQKSCKETKSQDAFHF